jgi:hypothetical protein
MVLMNTKDLTESQKALRALTIAMIGGLIAVLVYAGSAGSVLVVASVGVMLSGAAALVGGALGFLFGIPRTLQHDGPSPDAALPPRDTEPSGNSVDYRVNTNLEQISDWLTKILVGVGLTQIPAIREGLGSVSAFAAKGLGSQPHGEVFAFALLSYSAILGFLFGFLWTRLFLAGALRLADQAAIGVLAKKVEKATAKAELNERKIDELKKQSALDAEALNLAYRQLNPSPELPDVTQEALDDAVAAASRPIKVQVFNQAWQVRSETWRDAATKPKMERTIPLFRSLIRNDVENRYHMNHGQLGFALKDKVQPDWGEAERELTTAIEIRGPWREHGWLFYEFNRAVCRIAIDPAFANGRPSDESRKARILEDLSAVATATDIGHSVDSLDPIVQRWMSLNDVTIKDLRRLAAHAGDGVHVRRS